MNAEDIKFYLNVISSDECQCQAWKKIGFPLCYACYKRVDHLKDEFFRGGTADKAEAYDEALKFLNE